MLAQVGDIMSQASSRIVQNVAEFVPGALAVVTLLVGAAVLSVLARVLVLRLLTSMDFDRHAEGWGLGFLTRWPSGRSPSIVVARSTQWIILVLGLLVALTALDAAVPSRFTVSMFEYAPNVIAAAIVLALAILYVVVPWIGVMASGYAFGRVMELDPDRRRAFALRTGIAMTLLFVVLGAPDVAHAEVVVGAIALPVLYLVAIGKCRTVVSEGEELEEEDAVPER